ncbi:MAG TPA: GAF domain-containing protein [Burkholderiaceae bacterium]|nr:GAF domain-containing protein [Burkholderiaceae bacterium]
METASAQGAVNLTNCELEPIHLIGAVQPHGVLLAVREADGLVVQASSNTQPMLSMPTAELIDQPLACLGGDLAEQVDRLARGAPLDEPAALQCVVAPRGQRRRFEGAVHRVAAGLLVIELEPLDPLPGLHAPTDLAPDVIAGTLSAAVQRFSAAPSVGTLADAVVQAMRDLTGYDRVMVYKFDPDGHGKVIAESRHPRLASLLGHHYPASDIPQRARSLYLRNRVRMLVDVDDKPQVLEPPLMRPSGEHLDMSMCSLRSMSPIHLQYLRNMGVAASFSASLVREGQLWGLVAAHHYAPRCLRRTVRAAAELLAEVASTRIAAIENYAHAQVALMVRRLEQRLVEATSTEGDWRYAIFRNPRTLLQPLEATGAALFHDGELLTSGEVPSTPELRALVEWIDGQAGDEPFACSSVGKAEPALAGLTPTASGVLAVRLSTSRPDYLVWLRKEQLLTVTWAGNPSKPVVGDNPLELSPRRSFEAWSEIVRGTAVPWSSTELALARAIGVALVDIIVQVQAVRLLIAEHQLGQVRSAVAGAREPVVVADIQGRVIFANEAFHALSPRPTSAGEVVADRFTQPAVLEAALEQLRSSPQAWRREMDLASTEAPLPVSVRGEVVTGRDGLRLGFIFVLTDLREARRAAQARERLEVALRQAARVALPQADDVVTAILANASLAAMDIADATGGPPVAGLLNEVEASTRRAAALYAQIRNFTS